MSYCTEDTHVDPVPLNIPKKQINSLAEKLGQELGLAPGDPLEPIVESLEGKIDYLSFDEWLEDKSGSLEVGTDGKFTIYVSAFSGPLRNRFTIAHELGHFFLHSKMGEIPIRVDRKIGKSDRLEWEANWFAAGLLMPTEEFRAKCEEFEDIDRIAAHFLVSTQAAETRIKDLGLRCI